MLSFLQSHESESDSSEDSDLDVSRGTSDSSGLGSSLWSSGPAYASNSCPLVHALMTGNKSAMEDILRHGMKIGNGKQIYTWYFETLRTKITGRNFRHKSPRIFSRRIRGNGEVAYIDRRKNIVREVVIFFLNLQEVKADSSGYFNPHQMISCFSLIWRSIPTPFVRYHETLDVISEAWAERQLPKLKERIRTCCDLFAECFGNQSPVEPRTLKHLSRCKIREVLSESSKTRLQCFPLKTKELDVPQPITDYLELLN